MKNRSIKDTLTLQNKNTIFVLMAKTFALTAVLITMQDQEPFVTMAFLRGLIKSRQGIKYMVRPANGFL